MERKFGDNMPQSNSSYHLTSLFGNLDFINNEEAAKVWLKAKLHDLGVTPPSDIYAKGDFQNMLFAKFGTTVERDNAVLKMWKSNFKIGDKTVWSRPDLPIDQRVPQAFLFALKKQLLQWNYTKEECYVDIGK